jgi:hypothetical protein
VQHCLITRIANRFSQQRINFDVGVSAILLRPRSLEPRERAFLVATPGIDLGDLLEALVPRAL